VLFALDHAGAGNEEEIARANVDIADLEGRNQTQKPFTAEHAESPSGGKSS
jgi:hypothetical protein